MDYFPNFSAVRGESPPAAPHTGTLRRKPVPFLPSFLHEVIKVVHWSTEGRQALPGKGRASGLETEGGATGATDGGTLSNRQARGASGPRRDKVEGERVAITLVLHA